jgi:hypothetical protein
VGGYPEGSTPDRYLRTADWSCLKFTEDSIFNLTDVKINDPVYKKTTLAVSQGIEPRMGRTSGIVE